ncbi:hypothetical protein QVD17_06111 [Tagetes erecta]|uniref:MBD domain-containing protein n=1 Tax=Tagetes erecta TaxID=13708 RepID=A0AAD8LJJ0_TARER|nr:hypothetical protein QVD17_06111 [Tagetes erecta]
MRTIYTPLQTLVPPPPHFLRRPRSIIHRRRRTCFRTWKNFFVSSKRTVKPNKTRKQKKKLEEVSEKKQEYKDEDAIDLNLLARVGDGAYATELERLTKGMNREELVGFMDSLDGDWCRRSDRRKVVDAAVIVKVLPVNWKIEIAIRRRAGLSFLYCRSYVSPSGMQFKSCKDVAVYLRDQSSIDVAAPSIEGEMRQISDGSHMFLKSINNVTSSPTLREANNNLLSGINDLHDVKVASHIDCFPCKLTFDDMDGLKKHLAIFHKRTTRKFELPKKRHTSDEEQTDPGHHAVVNHEPRLGEASSRSQTIAEAEEPVAIANDNGRFRTKCTWCNKEFLCGPVDAETMADAVGFMCPECKEQLCGVLERSLIRCYQR